MTKPISVQEIANALGTETPDDIFPARINQYLAESSSRTKLSSKVTRKLVETAMKKVFLRKSVLFCVDVEAWERETRLITEIGVSIYDPRGQEYALSPYIQNHHILIQETLAKRNGKFVPEHSANFNGGLSYVLCKEEAIDLMQTLIRKYFGDDLIQCLLVGHDVRGDIKWLTQMGIEMPPKMDVLDTQTLYSHTHGKKGNSLKNALRDVGQPYAFLHNAGNDAYYTVLLALRLCDPQVRKLTQFDQLEKEESTLGRRINTKLDHNRSKAVITSKEAILTNTVDVTNIVRHKHAPR